MSEKTYSDWIEKLNWDDKGLLPAIAQEHSSGKVLCLAWMNRQALALTVEEQRAIYWSRSRNKLWRKGEQSGHVQHLREIRVDCDLDVILLKVIQEGDIACHTGRHSCFYLKLENQDWQAVDPVLKDPKSIYNKS